MSDQSTIPPAAVDIQQDAGAIIYLEVPAHTIVKLQALFESYEGMGIVRTMNREKCILSILTTRDMLENVVEILKGLSDEFPWRFASDLSEQERESYRKTL